MLAVAHTIPLDWLTQISAGEFFNKLLNSNLGSVVALAISILLLFVVPEMTVRQRLQREENPGEFRTPMLVLYRWVWIGIVLLALVGFLAARARPGRPDRRPGAFRAGGDRPGIRRGHIFSCSGGACPA